MISKNFLNYLLKIKNSNYFIFIEFIAIFIALIGLFFSGIGIYQASENNKANVIASAWNNLSTPSVGNSGKRHSIETLLSENQSLYGIDLSCRKMSISDPSTSAEYPIVIPVDDWHPLQNKYEPNCEPFTFLAGLNTPDIKSDALHDLRATIFSHSDLSGAKIGKANLSGSIFDMSVLSGVEINESDLSKASFIGVDLSNTVLSNVRLSGARFTGATVSEKTFKQVTFGKKLFFNDSSVWTTLDLKDLIFKGRENESTQAVDLNFVRAHVDNLDASNLTILNGQFTDFQRIGANPVGLANFSNSTIYGVNGRRDRHTTGSVSFDSAMLAGANFKDARLIGIEFENTILRNADFSGATFTNVEFKNVDITGATFCDERSCAIGVDEKLLNGSYAIETPPLLAYRSDANAIKPVKNEIEVIFSRLCSYDNDWLSRGSISLESSLHLVDQPKIKCVEKLIDSHP